MDDLNQIKSAILASFLFLFLLMAIPSFAAKASVADPVGIAASDDERDPVVIKDPLERFNRAAFAFNDKFDNYLLKPTAQLYNAIVPKPLNQGIHNVYNNINTIPTIFNDILQIHIYQATSDFWRLLINTTLGIGGLFDVAARLGLEPYANDFGLTLAAWGYKNSSFLVIPVFGPSTVRDGIEIPIDYYAFSIYPYIDSTAVQYGIWGLSVVDRRAQLLKYQSVFDEAALDKYAFQRNAYLQRRQSQVDQNQGLGVSMKERRPRTLEDNSPSNTNIGID